MISGSGTYRNVTELPARRLIRCSRGVVLGGTAVVVAAMRERCPFVESAEATVAISSRSSCEASQCRERKRDDLGGSEPMCYSVSVTRSIDDDTFEKMERKINFFFFLFFMLFPLSSFLF